MAFTARVFGWLSTLKHRSNQTVPPPPCPRCSTFSQVSSFRRRRTCCPGLASDTKTAWWMCCAENRTTSFESVTRSDAIVTCVAQEATRVHLILCGVVMGQIPTRPSQVQLGPPPPLLYLSPDPSDSSVPIFSCSCSIQTLPPKIK